MFFSFLSLKNYISKLDAILQYKKNLHHEKTREIMEILQIVKVYIPSKIISTGFKGFAKNPLYTLS